MTTITNQPSQYQKLLEQSKTVAKQELPTMKKMDTLRNDKQDTSSAINENIKKVIGSQIQSLEKKPEGLSEDTIAGLKMVAEDNAKNEVKFEEDDDYIYDDYNNRFRNLHLNRKRRKAIEDRCSEMNISDLLVNGYVEQVVPIVPEKLVITFRSMSGREDLLVKSMMAKEVTAANQMSASYMIGKLSMLNLACSLVKINGRPLMDIKGADGKPDEKLLQLKFEHIASYPIDLLADFSANYSWFTERVKSLSVADNIINF